MKNISQIRKKIIKEYLAYHKEKQKNIDFFNSPYTMITLSILELILLPFLFSLVQS